MSALATRAQAPASYEDAAAVLARCAAERVRVRIRGGGTKIDWGCAVPEPDVELSTSALSGVVEHNPGDFTALVRAGTPLASAQRAFAEAGQRLSLDPPDGGATVGGVVASGDSGPLRHRYGAPRDLVLGMTAALTSGELVRAGSRVIKNVAGYDLAKLFAGSFGTLGAIVELALRLHPLPAATATLVGGAQDPDALARATGRLTHAALDAEALDVRWADGAGAVLARFAGRTASRQAAEAVDALGSGEVVEDDEPLWAAQREAQRGPCVVRVSGLQTDLVRVIEVAGRHGGTLVGRATLGLSWIALESADGERVAAIRRELAPRPCVVLDAARELRTAVDPWGEGAPTELMRRVKARFDPHGTLNPGVVAAGI